MFVLFYQFNYKTANLRLVGSVTIKFNKKYCKIFQVFDRMESGEYFFFYQGAEFYKEDPNASYDGDLWVAKFSGGKEYRQTFQKIIAPSRLHEGYYKLEAEIDEINT